MFDRDLAGTSQHLFARLGEVECADAMVLGIGAPLDEPFLLEAVDQGDHSARGYAKPLGQCLLGGAVRRCDEAEQEKLPGIDSQRLERLAEALGGDDRATAELLAEHGVVPPNLRAGAGLGLRELLDELVALDGRLAPRAGAQRAFYRPHSGFPARQPSDDRREVLDESLSWAARNDRVETLDVLVAHGASVEADVYRGTALAWAAVCGHTASIRRLVALGADPSQRTTFGGPGHGEDTTPLHLAAQKGDLDAIRALLDLGADPALKDAPFDSTPAEWAEHGGHKGARDLLHGRCG